MRSRLLSCSDCRPHAFQHLALGAKLVKTMTVWLYWPVLFLHTFRGLSLQCLHQQRPTRAIEAAAAGTLNRMYEE